MRKFNFTRERCISIYGVSGACSMCQSTNIVVNPITVWWHRFLNKYRGCR